MRSNRNFQKQTRINRFNYMKTYVSRLKDGKWVNEKKSQLCDVPVGGVITTMNIKKALNQESCGISPTLLARTTDWLERRKGKDGRMEVRWVAGEFTEEMMNALTLILDDAKNGARNREIAAEKLRLKKESEVATKLEAQKKRDEVIPEPTDEEFEDNMTTVEEVLNDHMEKQFPTTEEIGELFVEGLKETYGEKFNNLFMQVQAMREENKEIKAVLDKQYQIFCVIAGIEPE